MFSYSPFTIFTFSILSLPLIFFLLRCLSLIPPYLRARRLNLPIHISLVTWQDPIWILLHPYFLFLSRLLPFPPFNGLPYSYLGWTAIDKGRTHTRLGNAFAFVSPNHLEIFTADPAVCLEVTRNWRVWTKSPELYDMFNTFGHNILTADGSSWQRHRKIAGGAFREETYDLVWDEARKQASQLLSAVERRGGQDDLVVLREDFALLAMHVLSAAVLGQSYDYGAGLQQVEEGHQLSYFASLASLLQNIAFVMILKGLSAPDWCLPKFLRKIKLTVSEFQLHLSEAVQREHNAVNANATVDGSGSKTKRSGASLVSALVRANEEAKSQAQTEEAQTPEKSPSSANPITNKSRMYLTESELYGNMYIFNLGGFETTSFALSFSVLRLALDPALQEWIGEEIDLLWKAQNSESEGKGVQLSYENAFPKLTRCRALMYETLRYHAAAAVVSRTSKAEEPVELEFHSLGKRVLVPRDTYVTINLPGLHNSPLWGSDASTYRPQRWITSTTTNPASSRPHTPSTSYPLLSTGATNALGDSLIPEPSPSKSDPDDRSPLFIPWLAGPRVCPGKKFSQVEFVGVIAEMFAEWRVEPKIVCVKGDGEGKEGREGEEDNGAMKALRDSVELATFNMLPKLWRPKMAGVRWVRREGGRERSE